MAGDGRHAGRRLAGGVKLGGEAQLGLLVLHRQQRALASLGLARGRVGPYHPAGRVVLPESARRQEDRARLETPRCAAPAACLPWDRVCLSWVTVQSLPLLGFLDVDEAVVAEARVGVVSQRLEYRIWI